MSRDDPHSGARAGRTFLAVPLVLVNTAAVFGQAGWAYDNITRGGVSGFCVAVLFALAIESIGVYLAWESHESLMADQASVLLRLGSYAVGGLAGTLNFLHFSPQSFATGVAFGALSAISPWLWAIWSRARNRTRLNELGLVDVRGVRLSTSRKLWHPILSWHVTRWAAWAGITNPQDAVTGWEKSLTTSGEVEPDPPAASVPSVVQGDTPPVALDDTPKIVVTDSVATDDFAPLSEFVDEAFAGDTVEDAAEVLATARRDMDARAIRHLPTADLDTIVDDPDVDLDDKLHAIHAAGMGRGFVARALVSLGREPGGAKQTWNNFKARIEAEQVRA